MRGNLAHQPDRAPREVLIPKMYDALNKGEPERYLADMIAYLRLNNSPLSVAVNLDGFQNAVGGVLIAAKPRDWDRKPPQEMARITASQLENLRELWALFNEYPRERIKTGGDLVRALEDIKAGLKKRSPKIPGTN